MKSNAHMAAQQMLAEHQTEIRRRAAVKNAGAEQMNSRTFKRVDDDGLDDPFENPEQVFMVFSLSQREFAPVPRDLSRPGLCIYGAFETRAEAMEHAAIVQKAHPGNSILIDETHSWVCAPATIAHLQDASHVKAQKTRLLGMVAQTRAQSQQDFQENVAEQRAGKVSAPPADRDDDGEKEDEKEDENASRDDDPDRTSARIDRTCRVDAQSLAVVSFVADDSSDGEFIFRVYGFFPDETSANKYVRNVCGCNVQDFDIDVIKACCWAFPQQMQGKHVRKEVYRSDELNKVMTALKQAPQEVKRFYDDHSAYKETAEEDRRITLTAAEEPEDTPPASSTATSSGDVLV